VSPWRTQPLAKSHIVVLMLWEAGHLLPTMKLARELTNRGHELTFVTIPELLDIPRSRGFRAVAILSGVFPTVSSGREPHRCAESQVHVRAGLEQALREAVIEREIQALQPDLVLVDSMFFRTHAEGLRKRGLLLLIVTTSLPHESKGGVPRLDSHRLPGGAITNRLAIAYSWIEFFAGQWFEYFLRRAPMAPPRLGVKTAEIVLCPEELDFPRPRRSGRHYGGPGVELDRPVQEFPWHLLTSGAKLIYFSLGTQSHRYPALRELALSVVAAVGQRADEQLVLVAKRAALAPGSAFPGNVVIVEQAPQIELLRLASIAIIHAGLGTIKECILMGVPMIVFPQAFDQPGNAARVEFHGLGLRCVEQRYDANLVRRFLDTLHGSPSIRQNVRRMRGVFEAASGRCASWNSL
jgi:zeaxanthin glucosyltransferase